MHCLHLMYFKCLRVTNWYLAQMEIKEEKVSHGGGSGEGIILLHMLFSECKPASHSCRLTHLLCNHHYSERLLFMFI